MSDKQTAPQRTAGGQFAMGAAMASKGKAKAPKATSTGFGESKVFADPNAPGMGRDWTKLTCNGGPIPEHLWSVIPYEATDQGIAEREALRQYEPSGITLGADPVDKKIREYGDGLEAGMEPWETPDPLRDTMEPHAAAGFRHRWLSPAKIQRDGKRGWEVVQYDDGGTVKDVTLGNMVLGRMPEGKARSRDRHMRDRAEGQMVAAQNDVRRQQEEIMGKSRMDRVARKKRIEDGDIGIESVRGDAAEFEDREFQ